MVGPPHAVCHAELNKGFPQLGRCITARLQEHEESRSRELAGAHRVLGVRGEVKLSCFCVVAVLDWHGQGIMFSL